MWAYKPSFLGTATWTTTKAKRIQNKIPYFDGIFKTCEVISARTYLRVSVGKVVSFLLKRNDNSDTRESILSHWTTGKIWKTCSNIQHLLVKTHAHFSLESTVSFKKVPLLCPPKVLGSLFIPTRSSHSLHPNDCHWECLWSVLLRVFSPHNTHG